MSTEIVPGAFRPVDPSLFTKRRDEALTRPTGGNFEFFKLRKSDAEKPPIRNILRLMPAHPNMVNEDGMADPFIIMKQHFSLGPKQDTASPCRLFFNEPCPVEDWIEVLRQRAGMQQDPDQAKTLKDLSYKIRAQWRIYAQVVDKAAPERGVQPWAFGNEIEKMVRACFFDDFGAFRDITDPTNGRWILIDVTTKKGTTWPEYPLCRAAESSSALEDMEWLKLIKDLNIYRFCPTLDDVKGALTGKRIERNPKTVVSVPSVIVPKALDVAPTPGDTPRSVGSSSTAPTPGSPAPVPTPASPAPVPTPVVVPSPPAAAAVPTGKKTRTAAAASGPVKMYQAARLECSRLGFQTPLEPDPPVTWQDVIAKGTPSCYTEETDPADPTCQGCILLLPCLTAKLKLAA